MSTRRRRCAITMCLPYLLIVGFPSLFVFNAFADDVEVEPWEVRLYTQNSFKGDFISYQMELGMRHKLVGVLPQGYEKQVYCVAVGSQVAVALYKNRLWVAADILHNTTPDYLFTESLCSPQLAIYPLFQVSSLVVFPRAAVNPQGVWLWDERFTLDDPSREYHLAFFPLPEMEQDKEASYPLLGDRDLDKNANVVMACDENIEITLYEGRNYTGASLMLPSPGGWAQTGNLPCIGKKVTSPKSLSPKGVNFGQYSWSDRAASLVVRWKGPMLGLGPKSLFNIEQGYDLPGSDYKSFSTKASFSVCDVACGSDPKCLAYTWVKPSVSPDATCYLKSFAPNRTQNPNCISGVRKGISVTGLFKVNQGIDLPGQDYKKAATGGSHDCEKACLSDSRCLAFTWVEPGVQGSDAVCWLKLGVPDAIQKLYCVSGVRKGISVTGLFNINQVTDLPGQNYKNLWVTGDYDECEKACRSDPQCLAFTWVQPGVKGPNAACFLKSGGLNATQDLNCISGVRKGISVTGLFYLNPGMNLPGQDYKNVSVKGGSDECERACGSDSNCQAFTWVKPGVQGSDAVCWLKSDVGGLTEDPNCVTGVRNGIFIKKEPSKERPRYKVP